MKYIVLVIVNSCKVCTQILSDTWENIYIDTYWQHEYNCKSYVNA